MNTIVSAFLTLTYYIGQLSTSFACWGDYYQPEVPAELMR